jgi:hypothetical protein
VAKRCVRLRACSSSDAKSRPRATAMAIETASPASSRRAVSPSCARHCRCSASQDESRTAIASFSRSGISTVTVGGPSARK